MTALLRKVKTRMSIRAHRRVRGLLEGEYTSVFHGRSVEFDDLRQYVAGDELKDIDWKATARVGAPMTRRYIAARKHTILIVADTGRDMAALAAGGEPKIDVAVVAAGVLGYVATRHGDLVSLVAGDAEHTEYRRPESTDSHLERVLQVMHGRTRLTSAPSDLTRQLTFVIRSFRKRMILLVLSDDRELTAPEITLLRRLSLQHEILWLTVGDADPMRLEWSDAAMYDVAGTAVLPEYVRSSPRLRDEFRARAVERMHRSEQTLESLGISAQRIERETQVVPALFRLLEGHRHARR